MNILAIDDNADILQLLDTVLTSNGHDFTQVGKIISLVLGTKLSKIQLT